MKYEERTPSAIMSSTRNQYATKQRQQQHHHHHSRDSTNNKSNDTIVFNVRYSHRAREIRSQWGPLTKRQCIHWHCHKMFSSRRAPAAIGSVTVRAHFSQTFSWLMQELKRAKESNPNFHRIFIIAVCWTKRENSEMKQNIFFFILCSTTLHAPTMNVQPLLFLAKTVVGRFLNARLTFNTWVCYIRVHNAGWWRW